MNRSLAAQGTPEPCRWERVSLDASNLAESVAARLLALNRMGVEICHADAESDLLIAAGNHVQTVFDVDWGGIGLRSVDGQRVRLLPLEPHRAEPETGADLPIDGLAIGHVIATGQILSEADLDRSPYRDLAGLASTGMRHAIVIPLRVGDLNVGALALARQASPFGDIDKLLAMQAGAFVGSAIKSIRAAAEAHRAETERHKAQMVLSRRAGELDSLNRISNALSRMELRHVVELITTEVAALRGIELCRISAIDDEGVLTIVASASQHGARFQDGDPIVRSGMPDAIAVETQRSALWRRPSDEDHASAELLRTLGVTSVFSLPISWQGQPMGAFTAGSTGGHRLVTDEHIVMCQIVCQQLASAVAEGRGHHGLWQALVESGPIENTLAATLT